MSVLNHASFTKHESITWVIPSSNHGKQVVVHKGSIESRQNWRFSSVMGIRDILVRIRIQLRIRFLSELILRIQKKYFFHIFLITCPQAHHFQYEKFIFLLEFCVKILFCRHYFSQLNTFIRKGKDPEPDPDHWLMDPDPGGPKICGSGSPTLVVMLKKYSNVSMICLLLCWSRQCLWPPLPYGSRDLPAWIFALIRKKIYSR